MQQTLPDSWGSFREFNPNHDAEGKFASGRGSGVPKAPGTEPIPAGMMRRFHVTGLSNIDSIREKGLTMQAAKGIEGPRAVYSWPDLKSAEQYGANVNALVEFWTHPSDFDSNPVATLNPVKPEQIVAIHEPWHRTYRYIAEEPDALKATLAGEHDALAKDDPEHHGKAIAAIKRDFSR